MQKLRDFWGTSSSNLPGCLNGTTCIQTRKTLIYQLCVPAKFPELAKLNSAFSRVAKHSLPAAPPSWARSQDILSVGREQPEYKLWCATRLLVYLDAWLECRTQCLLNSGPCVWIRASRLRERSKLWTNWSIWWFSTGLSPKPWPAQCRTCLKAFSSAWRTLPLHIDSYLFTCWCKGGHPHCTAYRSRSFAVTFPRPGSH